MQATQMKADKDFFAKNPDFKTPINQPFLFRMQPKSNFLFCKIYLFLICIKIETLKKMKLLQKELSEGIIGAFYEVYNQLGYGFLERVYQNSLFHELKAIGYSVEAQKRIKVYYKELEVGDYFADLVVNDVIILELKAAEKIAEEHETQLLNYLRATDKEIGLLFNFGMKPEFKRKFFLNSRKKRI